MSSKPTHAERQAQHREKKAARLARHHQTNDPSSLPSSRQLIQTYASAPYDPEPSKKERLEQARLTRDTLEHAHHTLNTQGLVAFLEHTGPYAPGEIEGNLRQEDTALELDQARGVGLWHHPNSPEHKLHVVVIKTHDGWRIGLHGALLPDLVRLDHPPFRLPEDPPKGSGPTP